MQASVLCYVLNIYFYIYTFFKNDFFCCSSFISSINSIKFFFKNMCQCTLHRVYETEKEIMDRSFLITPVIQYEQIHVVRINKAN
jgi:hypothetical protein